MQFDSFAEFLAMGGYATFVWPSYALTIVILGALLVASLLRHRYLVRQLGRIERRQRRGRRT